MKFHKVLIPNKLLKRSPDPQDFYGCGLTRAWVKSVQKQNCKRVKNVKLRSVKS